MSRNNFNIVNSTVGDEFGCHGAMNTVNARVNSNVDSVVGFEGEMRSNTVGAGVDSRVSSVVDSEVDGFGGWWRGRKARRGGKSVKRVSRIHKAAAQSKDHPKYHKMTSHQLQTVLVHINQELNSRGEPSLA